MKQVWGQPGFPRWLLTILFFSLLAPRLWDTGERHGGLFAAMSLATLPEGDHQPHWLMEKLDHAPAASVKVKLLSFTAVLKKYYYFSPWAKQRLLLEKGECPTSSSWPWRRALVCVKYVACETTSRLLEWTAATSTSQLLLASRCHVYNV